MRYELTKPSVLKGLIEEAGFSFSKSLGQNFIISQSVVERMAEEAGLDENTGVLEIGPGAGTLTQELALRAGKVSAVEIDSSLIPLLGRTLEDYPNVEIVNCDALKLDIEDFCKSHLDFPHRAACANLPYYITTQLVSMLLRSHAFDTIVVMMQKEAAQRLCSSPGDDNYCAAAAEVGYFADAKVLFHIPAEYYIPRPKVGSVVVRLTPKKNILNCEEEAFLLKVIDAAFAQRRKTLANTLTASGICTREEADAAIAECGFKPAVRGEALSADDFIRLSEALRK